MKNEFEQKVYYADTDAYGVVWHGSYLRWLEAGRCKWCEDLGIDLIELERNHDIVLPVVSLNIRYKLSAKLGDIVIIETVLEKFNSLSAMYKQVIKSKETGRVYLEASVEIVAIMSSAGKLYRKMPEVLAEKFRGLV